LFPKIERGRRDKGSHPLGGGEFPGAPVPLLTPPDNYAAPLVHTFLLWYATSPGTPISACARGQRDPEEVGVVWCPLGREKGPGRGVPVGQPLEGNPVVGHRGQPPPSNQSTNGENQQMAGRKGSLLCALFPQERPTVLQFEFTKNGPAVECEKNIPSFKL